MQMGWSRCVQDGRVSMSLGVTHWGGVSRRLGMTPGEKEISRHSHSFSRNGRRRSICWLFFASCMSRYHWTHELVMQDLGALGGHGTLWGVLDEDQYIAYILPNSWSTSENSSDMPLVSYPFWKLRYTMVLSSSDTTQ